MHMVSTFNATSLSIFPLGTTPLKYTWPHACVSLCVFNPCSCGSFAHLFFAEVTVNNRNSRERPTAPAVAAGMSSRIAAAEVPTEAKSAAGSDLTVALEQLVMAADVAGASVRVPDLVDAESDAKHVQQQ